MVIHTGGLVWSYRINQDVVVVDSRKTRDANWTRLAEYQRNANKQWTLYNTELGVEANPGIGIFILGQIQVCAKQSACGALTVSVLLPKGFKMAIQSGEVDSFTYA